MFFILIIYIDTSTIFVPYKILSILGVPFIFTRFLLYFFFLNPYQLYYIDHICYIINYETFFHYRIPLDFHYSNFKRVALNIKTKRHVVFNNIEGGCIKYEDFNEIMQRNRIYSSGHGLIVFYTQCFKYIGSHCMKLNCVVLDEVNTNLGQQETFF